MEKAVVLLVDDEEDFRTLSILQMERILKDQRLEFIEANNGEETLALLKQGLKPSVIILDFAMGKINGIELLRIIDRDYQHLYNVPRIIITGFAQEIIMDEAQNLRYVYFEKRFDNKSFYENLCRYLVAVLGG